MSPQISIQSGMTIGYPRRRFRSTEPTLRLATAENEISLSPGRHLLLARNGRGKTTLLKTLAGLIPAVGGEFDVEGKVQYIDEELRFDPRVPATESVQRAFPNINATVVDVQHHVARMERQRKWFGNDAG